MKENTAIEWFYRWINDNPEATVEEGLKAFETAKMIEKNQIILAFKAGLQSPYHQDYTIVTQVGQEETKSGQYYNETYKKNVENYLNTDIFIHFGSHEGLGLGFYESLYMGTPILTIDWIPNSEIVKELLHYLIELYQNQNRDARVKELMRLINLL